MLCQTACCACCSVSANLVHKHWKLNVASLGEDKGIWINKKIVKSQYSGAVVLALQVVLQSDSSIPSKCHFKLRCSISAPVLIHWRWFDYLGLYSHLGEMCETPSSSLCPGPVPATASIRGLYQCIEESLYLFFSCCLSLSSKEWKWNSIGMREVSNHSKSSQ